MDGKSRHGRRRPLHLCRWLAVGATSLIGSAALCASVVAQSAIAATLGSPTIVISGDSVLATSLPSFGQTTVSATRPDAITGSPVVIGVFSSRGNPLSPFSVNTTTPTALNPSGDCWQKGALSEALTPDLQPGDTVTVDQTQTGLFGSGPTSTSAAPTSTSSVVAPSDLSSTTAGPISGCSQIAPWARNAITSAPRTVASGAALNVSGVAQPLATGVSISASDGSKTSAPVPVTPAADGSWTANIPAAKLEPLASTGLTVTPVVAVPDVSTGAQAHIAGVGASVSKSSAHGSGSGGPASTVPGSAPTTGKGGTPKGGGPPNHKPAHEARVSGLRADSRVSLMTARRRGIQASFVVPRGIRLVQIRLLQRGASLYTAVTGSQRPGTRQTVTVPTSLAKHLHAGNYTLAIEAGATRTTLGPATTQKIQITVP